MNLTGLKLKNTVGYTVNTSTTVHVERRGGQVLKNEGSEDLIAAVTPDKANPCQDQQGDFM